MNNVVTRVKHFWDYSEGEINAWIKEQEANPLFKIISIHPFAVLDNTGDDPQWFVPTQRCLIHYSTTIESE